MRINAIDGFREDVSRLHAALEASYVVGTWDWDHVRGVVVYDEGAARLLTGDPTLAERDLTGAMAGAAIHPADAEWLAQHMKDAARVGGLVLAEYRVMSRGGGTRWLLCRGRTYQDDDGRPLRSRGILIDITEMREDGERYVLGSSPAAADPLERAADLAMTLKQTLGTDGPPESRLLVDMLLLSLGKALAQSERY